MFVLRELASAKINLYLHVTGKRKDGYHLLDSLAVFTDVADKVEAVLAETLTFAVDGPFAGQLPDIKDNIVFKAARLLQERFQVTTGAALTLHKHLPVGSGMGGGSADAAATLRLLLRLWKIKLPPEA